MVGRFESRRLTQNPITSFNCRSLLFSIKKMDKSVDTDVKSVENEKTTVQPQEIEMTSIVVNKTTEAVYVFGMYDAQDANLYQYSPEELGAPTAGKKDSLFDWQMENAGSSTVERFGGVNGIAKTLGTSLQTVSLCCLLIFIYNGNLPFVLGLNYRTS